VVWLVNKHGSTRPAGLHVYAAFPKLLLLGLAAVVPALAFAGVRVLAWESVDAHMGNLGPVG